MCILYGDFRAHKLYAANLHIFLRGNTIWLTLRKHKQSIRMFIWKQLAEITMDCENKRIFDVFET